jgi:hypothetical protein
MILGSNDGNVYHVLHNVPDFGFTSTYQTREYTVDNTTTPYRIFRLLLMNTVGNATCNMNEWRLFGTPGPTTLDKGSLTLGRSLDVPRISRYDVDTETPRPEKLVLDFDTTVNSSPTDISGKGNHGTMVGATYSSADKAFNYVGTSGNTIKTETGFSGNQSHTISLWFNPDVVDANQNMLVFISSDGGTDLGRSIIYFNTTQGTVFDFRSKRITSATLPVVGQWMHLVSTYNSSNGATKMYMNGVLKTDITEVNASTTINLVNGALAIGNNHNGNEQFDGKISNFKLYDVALEPSEVKKLYNLGRTGRSMVISDTAVGIGKVPEAQLDVRGNMIVRGAITNDYYACFEVNESYYLSPDYLSWRSNDNQISFNSGITLINQSEIELGVPGIYMAFVKLNSDSAQNGRGIAIYAQYYDGTTWHTEISNGQLSIDYNGGTEVMTQHMLRATTHTKWRFYMTHNFTNAPAPITNRFFVASGQWSRLMISKIA